MSTSTGSMARLLASLYRVDFFFFSLEVRKSGSTVGTDYALRPGSRRGEHVDATLRDSALLPLCSQCCMCTFCIPPFAFEVGKVVPCLYLLEDGWRNDGGCQPVSQSRFFFCLAFCSPPSSNNGCVRSDGGVVLVGLFFFLPAVESSITKNTGCEGVKCGTRPTPLEGFQGSQGSSPDASLSNRSMLHWHHASPGKPGPLAGQQNSSPLRLLFRLSMLALISLIR